MARKQLLYSIIPLAATLALAAVVFVTQFSGAQFYAPIFGGLVGATSTYYFIQAKDMVKESQLRESVKKSIKSEMQWYSDTLGYFMTNRQTTPNPNLLSIQIGTAHYLKYFNLPHTFSQIYKSISFDMKLQNLDAETIMMLNDVYQQLNETFATCLYINDTFLEVNKKNCTELIQMLQTAKDKI